MDIGQGIQRAFRLAVGLACAAGIIVGGLIVWAMKSF